MTFIKCFMRMFSKYRYFVATFFSVILEAELASNFPLYVGVFEDAWIA